MPSQGSSHGPRACSPTRGPICTRAASMSPSATRGGGLLAVVNRRHRQARPLRPRAHASTQFPAGTKWEADRQLAREPEAFATSDLQHASVCSLHQILVHAERRRALGRPDPSRKGDGREGPGGSREEDPHASAI